MEWCMPGLGWVSPACFRWICLQSVVSSLTSILWFPLSLWPVGFTGEAGYTRVTILKICSMVEWFGGQISLGNGGLYKVKGVSWLHNFSEPLVCLILFRSKIKYAYLTRGHVLPLSVLLELLFPATYFEKVWPTGNTGVLGLSIGSVPNSLCNPRPSFPCPHLAYHMRGVPQWSGAVLS